MPLTRSEILYFAAGVAVGAAARSAYPIVKEKLGPLIAGAMAGAGTAIRDAYVEASSQVAEKVQAVQDAMAEMKHNAAGNGSAAGTTSSATVGGASS
jgi:hypothetical protein